MAICGFVLLLLLICTKGSNADCSAGELPDTKTESPVTGRWALNHRVPSSCTGKLTQYEIHVYNSAVGNVYLAMWSPLDGNNNYKLVEGSLKHVMSSNSGSLTVSVDQFAYVPSGSVVGAYVPSSSHSQVVGYVWFSNNYGLCGNTDANETVTTMTCSTTIGNIEWARLHIQADIETVDCGSLSNISNGNVSYSSTLYGSEALYQCNVTGYTLNGNQKRVCTQNGTWNGTQPSCELFNCTNPPTLSLSNGSVHGDAYTYRSSISYSCNEGYNLTGDTIITCGANMTWNTSVTTQCTGVDCGDPGVPDNGNQTVDDDGFIYPSIVSFSCNPGYILIGSNAIMCMANMTWNNTLPSCDPVNCSDPGVPNNGYKLGNHSQYTYDSTITFDCLSGYQISTQHNSITCLANGLWSNSVPECSLVTCDAPPILTNGTYNESSDNSYPFMTVVVYECNEGFIINGTNEPISCMANKEWSGDPPQCIQGCSQFYLVNGNIHPSNGLYIVGTVLTLSCINGYELQYSTSGSIECLTTGEWNYTTTPMCEAIVTTTNIPPASSSASSPLPPSSSSQVVLTSMASQSQQSIQSTSDSVSTTALSTPSPTHTVILSVTSSSVVMVPHSTMSNPSSKPSQPNQPSSSSVDHQTLNTLTTSSSNNIDSMLTTTSSVSTTDNTLPISPNSIDPSTLTLLSATDTILPTLSSSSPVGLYSGIAAAVLIILLVVAVVVIVVALLLVRRMGKVKEYNINSGLHNESHVNPIVISDVKSVGGNPGTVESVRYKSSKEVVEIVGDATYDDLIPPTDNTATADRNKMEMLQDYNYLSSTTIGEQLGGLTYEQPVSTLNRAEGVQLNIQQNRASYKPQSTSSSSLEGGHTNQLYLEVNDKDSMGMSYDPDEGMDVATYASNDDPILMDDHILQPYMELSEGITEKPVLKRSMKQGGAKESTLVNDLYNPSKPTSNRVTMIYEAPASQEIELLAQLRKRNVKFIPKKQLTIGDILGSGFYGTVYQATYMPKAGAEVMEVAVKTMEGKEDKKMEDKQERAKFLKEAVVMAQFKHTNVLKLHGILMENNECMIVTELMEKGDLKQFLGKLKPDPGELSNEELSHILLNFSRQVCMGLTYLSEKGFVHRDIAARNILVNAKNVCKIADFGLSRDLEDDSYYMANKNTKVPVKWTAPEALHYRKYSSASDVWSYGCLLYEIWTLGLSPFTGITNMESLRKVEKGYRLAPPPGCPRPVYEVMIKCWHPEAKQRPRFNDVMLCLLQQDSIILHIPEKELQTCGGDTQAAVIGANLTAGEKLYHNLQLSYSNT